MIFIAEAIAVGRHFGFRCLRLPHRHLGPCELLQEQSEGCVGFSLRKNPQNDRWEVDVVFPDSPASREPRLKEKTTLLKVNGQSATEMQHDQLNDMLHGPAGSIVSIKVKKGFFFGTETIVLKCAAPALLDSLVCFGLHLIRRRLGSCALVATLTARLSAGVNPARRCEQHFDEAILRRVLGLRLMETMSRSAKVEMTLMRAARPLSSFMVSLQVTVTVFCFLQAAKHELGNLRARSFFLELTILCREMRGKESKNHKSQKDDHFVMLSPI